MQKALKAGALIGMILMGSNTVFAGSLTPPGTPAKTMYTLDSIYNKLANFAATATEGAGSFVTPGTVSTTFHTLSEIYALLAAENSDLVAGNIKSGVTLFGVVGSLAAALTYGDNSATKVLTTATNAGSYDATNLSVGNVRNGVTYGVGLTGTYTGVAGWTYGSNDASKVLTIADSAGTYSAANLSAATVKSGTSFGVSLTGDYPSVTNPLPGDTGSTDAIAASIRAGEEAWSKAGALITGTMPTQTLSASSDTVSAGYYAATNLATVDSDLTAANIKSGTTLFGVLGTLAAGYTYEGRPHKTNQIQCWDTAGSLTSCTGTGQDGATQTGVTPSFTDNGNSTITDNASGLVWQKTDDGTSRTWSQALTYCNNNTAGLAGSGWRLPNINELFSIQDYSRGSPSINTTYFVGAAGNYYWSSSTNVGSTANVFVLGFHGGFIAAGSKSGGSNLVRCVRG